MGEEGEVEGDGVMARYSSAETVGKNSWGEAVAVNRCEVTGGRVDGERKRKRVVLVTCGSMKEARKIARGVVVDAAGGLREYWHGAGGVGLLVEREGGDWRRNSCW